VKETHRFHQKASYEKYTEIEAKLIEEYHKRDKVQIRERELEGEKKTNTLRAPQT